MDTSKIPLHLKTAVRNSDLVIKPSNVLRLEWDCDALIRGASTTGTELRKAIHLSTSPNVQRALQLFHSVSSKGEHIGLFIGMRQAEDVAQWKITQLLQLCDAYERMDRNEDVITKQINGEYGGA
jgi:hypothetical protein